MVAPRKKSDAEVKSKLKKLERTVRIPIENFAEYEAELGREIRQQVFQKAIPAAGKAVREALEQITIDRDIVFKGKMAKSWRLAIGNQPSSVRVYNTQPYASVVEYGRRAGATMPPVKVLEKWVMKKLGVPKEMANKVAWAVARKIHLEGIKARPILGDADVQELIQGEVTNAVVEHLVKAVEKVNRKYRS